MPPAPRPLRLSPPQRYAAAFVPALLALLFGAAVCWGALREQRSRAAVDQNHRSIEALQQVLAATLRGEAAERGYLLNRNPAQLARLDTAQSLAAHEFTRLPRLMDDDTPAERAAADSLRTVVGRLFATLRGAAAIATKGDVTAAAASARTGDAARAFLLASTLARAEERQLADRAAGEARVSRGLVALVVVGTVASVVISLVLNTLLSRYGAGQAALADELAGANRQLEEQSVELEAQAQELEQQNRSLEQLADRLRERTDAAEGANRAKGRFLAAMSHDLRTPLNAILGYAQLMEVGMHGPVTPEQAKDLERIHNSGRHLLSLINQVLTFARIEAGRMEVRPEPVPLDALVRGAESSFLPQAEEKELAYDCDTGPRGVWVNADPDRTEQILLNLVTNAIKFTDPGGRIEVRCEDDGETAAVHVSDTGRGIPAGEIGRIFEPFVQMERDRTADPQRGVGLGLAISRELAQAMGGGLTVESEVGRGSVFTLRLPRVPAPTRGGPATPGSSPASAAASGAAATA